MKQQKKDLSWDGYGYCFKNEIQAYINKGDLINLNENRITRKLYYMSNTFQNSPI